MKTAICSMDKDLNSKIAEVFGRCLYFIIVEIDNKKIEKIEIIKNENTQQTSGAGVSAAQLMAEKKVNSVIAGNIGPRAIDVLNQFDIKVYSGQGVIKDVLQQFIEGKISKIKR